MLEENQDYIQFKFARTKTLRTPNVNFSIVRLPSRRYK